MTFKGTPGKWHIVEFAGWFNITDSPHYESSNINDSEEVGEEQAKANAYLQAAAPDLLDALQNLVQLKEWKDRNGKDEHYQKAQTIAWEQVKSAIDKALNYQP